MPSDLPYKPPRPAPPQREPLTFDALRSLNGYDELGRAYPTHDQVIRLLDRLNFPHHRLPEFSSFTTPSHFWREVCLRVDQGMIEGGLEAVLAAAAHDYPYNRLFAQFAGTSVSPTADPPQQTVLERMYAEGPDGARFELTGVPAETSPREIARAVMANYAAMMGDSAVADGATGSADPRPVVVDLVQPDGSTSRLDPDQPIGHQGVREGDRLQVQSQTVTAGPSIVIQPARKPSRASQSVLVLRTDMPQALVLDQLRDFQSVGGAELEFASYHTYVFRLTRYPAATAVEIADAIRARLGLEPEDVVVTSGAHVRRVVAAVLADSLRRPKRKYDVSNVPAATSPAPGVSDLRPLPNTARVEVVRPDGTTAPVPPGQTLHELGEGRLRLSVGEAGGGGAP